MKAGKTNLNEDNKKYTKGGPVKGKTNLNEDNAKYMKGGAKGGKAKPKAAK